MFCGFGINAPEYGWNDYANVDVKGKIVIAMVNDPGFYDASLFRGKNMTYYGRWTYKFEEAQRQGAAGLLVLHNERPLRMVGRSVRLLTCRQISLFARRQ